MTTRVFTVPADEIDQLEGKLNQLLQKPEFQGYEVAACFPSSDFSIVVIIFAKVMSHDSLPLHILLVACWPRTTSICQTLNHDKDQSARSCDADLSVTS